MSLGWRCSVSTARRPTATGHDQKWCSQLGPGAPQTQALEALCRRAAVGKASKVRRQKTSLCWLCHGSLHSCDSRSLRIAAWCFSSKGAGRSLATKTLVTNLAWRCWRWTPTCWSCAHVAVRTDKAWSCIRPSGERHPSRGRASAAKAMIGGGPPAKAASQEGGKRPPGSTSRTTPAREGPTAH